MRTTKHLSFLTIILAIIITFSCSVAFAGSNQFSFSKNDMRKASIISGPVYYVDGAAQSISLSDIKNENPTIGFNKLYGVNPYSFTYKGEVPGNNAYKDYPKMSSGKLGGLERSWWENPTSISDKLKWDSNTTNDLHAKNLVEGDSPFSQVLKAFEGFFFAIFAGLNALCGVILDIEIAIANFDVGQILHIDPMGISKSISQIIVGTEGHFSPVLVVALVIFALSFVSLAGKLLVTGGAAFSKVIHELLILVLAMLLVSVSTLNQYTSLMDATVGFTSKIVSGIDQDLGNKLKLFAYDTGNKTSDTNNTMVGMTTKPYIDVIIQQQFDTTVNELDLYGNGVDTQKLWGISSETMKSIVEKVSQKYNVAGVSTGGINNSDSPNLGYMWYAMCSGVDTINPITVVNGKAVTNIVSRDRVLFVTDILSAISAEAGGSLKASNIIDHFMHTSYNAGGMFMIFLGTIMMCFAVGFSAGMALVGKIIFNMGFMFIPILPILLLIPSLRDTAKKTANTWINCIVLMALAQALVLVIIYTSAVMCSSVTVSGYLINIALMYLAGKYGPMLILRATTTICHNRPQLGFADRSIAMAKAKAENLAGRNFFNNNRNVAGRKEELKRNNNLYGLPKEYLAGGKGTTEEELLNNYNEAYGADKATNETGEVISNEETNETGNQTPNTIRVDNSGLGVTNTSTDSNTNNNTNSNASGNILPSDNSVRSRTLKEAYEKVKSNGQEIGIEDVIDTMGFSDKTKSAVHSTLEKKKQMDDEMNSRFAKKQAEYDKFNKATMSLPARMFRRTNIGNAILGTVDKVVDKHYTNLAGKEGEPPKILKKDERKNWQALGQLSENLKGLKDNNGVSVQQVLETARATEEKVKKQMRDEVIVGHITDLEEKAKATAERAEAAEKRANKAFVATKSKRGSSPRSKKKKK